ncbi:LOW QUALITY PROTEIN: zona pellucida sperm-binding protein 2 [Phoenicopterus ruber ruber]
MKQCLCTSRMWLLLLFGFVLLLAPCADGLEDQDLLEVTCHRDGMDVEFSRELGNYSWHVCVVDVSDEEIVSCDHTVDYERLLSVLFVNCTSLEHGQHQLRLRLMVNDTMGEEKNVTYSTHCNSVHADEIITPFFAGATNCTKDFMAVTFPRLIPSFSDEHVVPIPMTWTLSIDDGTRIHQLSLEQATQQGYSFLADGHNLILQWAFTATGVVSYKQNDKVLYTVALKLTYGPPERRLTVESRMLCAPGPAICNATHMTVAIPAFPGTLMAVGVEDKIIPADQLQENGIALDTKRGVKLHISRGALKSRLHGESCSGLQSHCHLKLAFRFHGETVAMVMHPECPCDQHTPTAAVCTQDGYMDFEILADSTTPPLDLNTLRLRDPACRPAFKSSLNDRVWFHVPLNGCGTRWFDGEKIVYENEVRALWADLPLRRISRDSELRLTVLCSFSNGDASLSRLENLPPLGSSMNQGPLSLVLLSYPEVSYRQPYRDDQYPIVRYLRQPIFLEVQVLNHNDPNLHLVLTTEWATASQDPSSLPQWNVVVDGCEYDLDSYRTVFHPVDGVSCNYRQRLEVKTFAFVSGDKALPGLVYFHCSVLICDRFQPDSPLCMTRCPRPSRSKQVMSKQMLGCTDPTQTHYYEVHLYYITVVESGDGQGVNSAVVSLRVPVLLVPEGWSATQGSTLLSKEAWAGITMTAVGIVSLVATMLVFLAFLECLKRRASMVNVVC